MPSAQGQTANKQPGPGPCCEQPRLPLRPTSLAPPQVLSLPFSVHIWGFCIMAQADRWLSSWESNLSLSPSHTSSCNMLSEVLPKSQFFQEAFYAQPDASSPSLNHQIPGLFVPFTAYSWKLLEEPPLLFPLQCLQL